MSSCDGHDNRMFLLRGIPRGILRFTVRLAFWKDTVDAWKGWNGCI